MRLVIIGCGYLGLRVAAQWRAAGGDVTALTRSPSRARELAAAGIEPVVGDVLDPASLAQLPTGNVLLHAVGFDPSAGVDKRTVFVEGLRHVITSASGRTDRIIAISSSSVYGQSAGEWVDEDSPCQPQSDGGRICLDAEQVLAHCAAETATRAVCLRLSGIYGPHRWLAKADALRRGEPLAGSGDAWLNLIQVDDAASAVLAAAAHPDPRTLYLVSDNCPVRREDYYAWLARLVGAPPPRFQPELQPRHGVGLNKRCSNQLLTRHLGLQLACPTYREGLQRAVVE